MNVIIRSSLTDGYCINQIIRESAALVAGLTDRMLKLYFLLAAATVPTLAQECCPTKVVGGTDSLAGTYNLYEGPANFLEICQ